MILPVGRFVRMCFMVVMIFSDPCSVKRCRNPLPPSSRGPNTISRGKDRLNPSAGMMAWVTGDWRVCNSSFVCVPTVNAYDMLGRKYAKYSSSISCLLIVVVVMMRANLALMVPRRFNPDLLFPSGDSWIPNVLWCWLVGVSVMGTD